MQIKSIATMLIAGCAIGMLTGCGVPQEEHDAIIAQLNADHEAALQAVNTELEDEKSLKKAAEERANTLNATIRESNALNEELKSSVQEAKESLANANSQISALESQLTSAKASISSAQEMAASAQNDAATARMEAEETERRFMALIENLINLQKVKPSDLGWPELEAKISSSSMDMGSDMGMDAGGSADSSAASDLLDAMGEM